MTLGATRGAITLIWLIHGAAGVCQDTPLAIAWTQVRTLRLADGPDAVHRRQIARAELRKYTQQKV